MNTLLTESEASVENAVDTDSQGSELELSPKCTSVPEVMLPPPATDNQHLGTVSILSFQALLCSEATTIESKGARSSAYFTNILCRLATSIAAQRVWWA